MELTPKDGNQLRVLLIADDNLETCQNLKQVLERHRYQVDIAATIAEARSSWRWLEYFAIILNRNLPDGSADELLGEIKYCAPNTAAIVINGFPRVASDTQSICEPVDDYLPKPLDSSTLLASLARIAEKRLVQQRATEAERLAIIGQTMAAIAHESRNATQRIQTAVDMLKLDFSDVNEVMIEVDRIEKANDDLTALLEEVRDFAAPLQLQKSKINLASVWRNAWQNIMSIRDDDKAKTARLNEKLDVGSLDCELDRFRFEQVFRNLFENSLAACETAPRIVVRSAITEGRFGELLKISIIDNGPGFAIEEPQRIFEPFFTTKQKGTGLGMAIVKRTIEAHGGSVAVGLDGGPGAEIVITLPRSFHT